MEEPSRGTQTCSSYALVRRKCRTLCSSGFARKTWAMAIRIVDGCAVLDGEGGGTIAAKTR